jgi:hypothetical protein
MYARIAFEGSPIAGMNERFFAESRESLQITGGRRVATPTPPQYDPPQLARARNLVRPQSPRVIEPAPGSSVLETTSWNAGGALEGSNVSHAERQFAEWFTSRRRDPGWRNRVRELHIHISHSPCDHCAPDLQRLGSLLTKAKLLRIQWDEIYFDPKEERSTSAAGLARLSGWTLIGPKPAGFVEPTTDREVKPQP